MEVLWISVFVTVSSCVIGVLFTIICLRCRFFPLLSSSKRGKEVRISDEESGSADSSSEEDLPPPSDEIVKPNGTTLSTEVNVHTEGEEEHVNRSSSVDPIPSAAPSTDSPPNPSTDPPANPSIDPSAEPSIDPPAEPSTDHALDASTDHASEDSTDPKTHLPTDLPQERESDISLGEDPAPPICGTLDFCRQSYGYISPNSHLRPSAIVRPEVVPEQSEPRRSEMFFDARSSPSRSRTLSTWREEIENMTAFNTDFSSGMARHSVLSKSYDASSEDSYNTAKGSSSTSEEEYERRAMVKKSPRKRFLSRKSRSIQRISSVTKDNSDKTGYSDWSFCREIDDARSPPKPGSDEFEGVEEVHETNGELTGDILRGNQSRPIPKARLNIHGVRGGSLKEKTRQKPLNIKMNTLSHEMRNVNNDLPKDDALFARPGSASSTDLCPPPRALSHPNIFLRSLTYDPRGKSNPKMSSEHPSLTVWCPPSSTGVQVTMNVSRKSGRKNNAKPCSAPPEVEYVNFKGTIKR